MMPKHTVTSRTHQILQLIENGHKEDRYSAWAYKDASFEASCVYEDEWLPSRFEKQPSAPVFELSSMTKALFLNTLFRMRDYSFEARVIDLVRNEFFKKELIKNELTHLTFDHFFSHTSGAKNWFWMKRQESLFEDCLKFISNERQGVSVYSDINYVLLTFFYQDLRGEDFSSWEEEIDFLNETLETQYVHASVSPASSSYAVPYYPYCFKEKKNYGPLSDTNGNFFAFNEFVSGHTGFLGSCEDVFKGMMFLIPSQTTLAEGKPRGETLFSFGLRDYHGFYGHKGYTGTSFFFKDVDHYQILLTNRTASRFSPPTRRIFSFKEEGLTRRFFINAEESDELSVKSILEASWKEKFWEDSYIKAPKDVEKLRDDLLIFARKEETSLILN